MAVVSETTYEFEKRAPIVRPVATRDHAPALWVWSANQPASAMLNGRHRGRSASRLPRRKLAGPGFLGGDVRSVLLLLMDTREVELGKGKLR
jgi:hypothetical protein